MTHDIPPALPNPIGKKEIVRSPRTQPPSSLPLDLIEQSTFMKEPLRVAEATPAGTFPCIISQAKICCLIFDDLYNT